MLSPTVFHLLRISFGGRWTIKTINNEYDDSGNYADETNDDFDVDKDIGMTSL